LIVLREYMGEFYRSPCGWKTKLEEGRSTVWFLCPTETNVWGCPNGGSKYGSRKSLKGRKRDLLPEQAGGG